MKWIEQELRKIKEQNLYRRRTLSENLKNFCSNDYLGLRKHPRVIEASLKALKEEGLGSGASQLVSGYTRYHKELEEKISEFKEVPSCVLFGSGYLANVGTIPVLAKEGDLILSDELNHASIIDGVRFSRAERVIFPHLDYEFVEDFLKKNRDRYKNVLIVTDSVFSMDGDVADVKVLAELSERYDCMLYLDEAHATGTVGRGKGVLKEFSVEWNERIIVMGTLSKAVGSYGAFVCGSKKLTELLINKARSLIFSTSLPAPVCAGATEAIRIIEENPDMVEKLRERAKYMYSLLKDFPFEVKFFNTPIIPLIVGDEREALRISEELKKRGVFIQAIRYPTVPKGRARLRITASLTYSDEDIELLINSLKEVINW